MREQAFLHFRLSNLSRFGDAIAIRDPAGASPRPALVDEDGTIVARRKFLILHEYRVPKDAALRFLEITRDDNPIHVRGDVIPGALTLSKTLLLLEVLLDDFSVSRVKAKFTGASFYAERTVNHFLVSPGETPASVSVEVNTYQAGRMIAKMEVEGAERATAPAEASSAGGGESVPPVRENLDLIRMFHASLGMEAGSLAVPSRLHERGFPRAFLASLPSGEMVRQFHGEGGMLNVLSLDFGHPPYPVSAPTLPEVRLEKGRAGPLRFSRIHARIVGGARTYGEGFALVNNGRDRELAGS